jgi:hypothetical protein
LSKSLAPTNTALREGGAVLATCQRQFARIEQQERRSTRAILAGSMSISATLLYTNGDIVIAGIAYSFAALWFIAIFISNGETR